MTILSRLIFPSRLLSFRSGGSKVWQYGGQKGIRHNRSGKKSGKMDLAPEFYYANENVEGMGRNLMKSSLFAIGICGISFAGATIWQYEEMRKIAKTSNFSQWVQKRWNAAEGWAQKEGNARQHLNSWWNDQTGGEKVFWSICLLNAFVFGCWQYKPLQGFMFRFFCSNPAARAVCWPMVLSTFSHYSALHLGMNMYVLHNFVSSVGGVLGKEQLLAFYLSAGVLSSLTSHVYKVVARLPGPSLGASGAIMGLLALFCCYYPESRLGIVFIPGINFSADSALKAVMCIDFAGILLGWKLFDHAAHLGGAIVGVAYAHFGKQVWEKRGPFMAKYHHFREKLCKSDEKKD